MLSKLMLVMRHVSCRSVTLAWPAPFWPRPTPSGLCCGLTTWQHGGTGHLSSVDASMGATHRCDFCGGRLYVDVSLYMRQMLVSIFDQLLLEVVGMY
jgi:hypothetical protein